MPHIRIALFRVDQVGDLQVESKIWLIVLWIDGVLCDLLAKSLLNCDQHTNISLKWGLSRLSKSAEAVSCSISCGCSLHVGGMYGFKQWSAAPTSERHDTAGAPILNEVEGAASFVAWWRLQGRKYSSTVATSQPKVTSSTLKPSHHYCDLPPTALRSAKLVLGSEDYGVCMYGSLNNFVRPSWRLMAARGKPPTFHLQVSQISINVNCNTDCRRYHTAPASLRSSLLDGKTRMRSKLRDDLYTLTTLLKRLLGQGTFHIHRSL